MIRFVSGQARWVVALGAGVAVAVLMALLVRVPVATVRPIPEAQPAAPVGVAKLEGEAADAVLREEAMMRDPTPLFLPTRWSASADVLPAEAWREPASSFRGYEPKLKFDETQLRLEVPAPVTVPAKPAEALALEQPKRPFLGLGETGATVSALPLRGAFLEVVSAGDGELVIAEPLAEARPPGDGVWQPLAFLVAVDTQGLIRPPVLTESSRVAAVDSYFQEHLQSVLHLGERLAPGFYRVGIGP